MDKGPERSPSADLRDSYELVKLGKSIQLPPNGVGDREF